MHAETRPLDPVSHSRKDHAHSIAVTTTSGPMQASDGHRDAIAWQHPSTIRFLPYVARFAPIGMLLTVVSLGIECAVARRNKLAEISMHASEPEPVVIGAYFSARKPYEGETPVAFWATLAALLTISVNADASFRVWLSALYDGKSACSKRTSNWKAKHANLRCRNLFRVQERSLRKIMRLRSAESTPCCDVKETRR